MSQKIVDLSDRRPLLDIASYGRRGPTRRDRLSPTEIDHIRRTVDRTPEVMVKVLTKGRQNLSAVQRHIEYLSRRGELDIETDDGERIHGRDMHKNLLEDWDLDLDDRRRQSHLSAANGREPPKLVHKLMFSMPPGTPPGKVLEAVQNFAKEEFSLQHRYAMVLHTDEPHPHVHMVVKAMSEQGERLNIRKATLRHWRAEFARHLRALGVPANATERAVRGETKTPKQDGIYRAIRRGDSTHMRQRVEAVARELSNRQPLSDSGRSTLVDTRSEVVRGWTSVGEVLEKHGQQDLAARVLRFVNHLPPVNTERELVAKELARQFAVRRTDEKSASRSDTR